MNATTPASYEGRSDRREGGRWTVLQRAKNTLLYALARTAIALVTPLPATWLRRLGGALGRLAYRILPGPRRLARSNLERVFPTLTSREQERLAHRVYVELGHHMADTVALLSTRRAVSPLPIEDASRRVLEEARSEGRGVVFASAHLGPWERVGASLVAAGVPLTVVAREGYDPRFTKLFDKLRGRLGVPAIYRGSAGAHVRIVRTLREGGVLGVLMDLRSRVPSIVTPFLGIPAKTAVGPARIALRTGAAVVVGSAAGEHPDLRITITRIETEGVECNASGEEALTRAMNAELSRRVLAIPQGWVWMHPRWAP